MMKTTVDVELDWQDEMKPEEQIIERAAELLVEQLQGRVEKECTDVVRTSILNTIRKKVEEIVAGVLTEEINLTNKYGEKKGDPKTLREIMVEEVKVYLNQRVNRDGQPIEYGGRDDRTRVQQFVRDEARKAITQQYGAEIDKAGKAIRAEMDDAIGAHLRKAVFQIAGVKDLPKMIGA